MGARYHCQEVRTEDVWEGELRSPVGEEERGPQGGMSDANESEGIAGQVIEKRPGIRRAVPLEAQTMQNGIPYPRNTARMQSAKNTNRRERRGDSASGVLMTCRVF